MKCADKIFERILSSGQNMQEILIAKKAPIFEYLIVIIFELFGVFLVFWIVSLLSAVFVGQDFKKDFLYALVFIPVIGVLQNWHNAFSCIFVRVAIGSDIIVCKEGFFHKKIDKLYTDNIDNVEFNTSFWGELFDYGSITIYSFGGNVHLPYIKNPTKIYEDLKAKVKERKNIND